MLKGLPERCGKRAGRPGKRVCPLIPDYGGCLPLHQAPQCQQNTEEMENFLSGCTEEAAGDGECNQREPQSGKKPTHKTSLIIDDGNVGSEDSPLSDALVLEDGTL
ncbi:uncharacterized protein WM277_015533 isoform 2-T2 [Molossus nigricans]